MNLGIFLSPGDSLEKQSLVGQDERFVNYYLRPYSKNFDKVFLYSYGDKNYKKNLPANVILIVNKKEISYKIYQFLFPFIHLNKLKKCHAIRVMQSTGVIPAVIAKLLLRKKIILTYGYDYAFFAKIEKKHFTAYLLSLLIPIALFFVDKIIVTSKINEKLLNRKYPGKIIYIPNGVDVNKLKIKSEKLKVKKRKKINILSIGRLVRQKNFGLLIDAMGLLKNKKNINLTIIGRGPEKNNLLNKAKQMNINLKIIEPMSYSKLISYYQKADFFCLPSLAEGQSKVLLEALACGLPILASDTAANREIIKNNLTGILFNFDKNDLASKIAQVIDNPRQVQKIRLQGRKYVEQNHNLIKLVEEEIKLLKNDC